MTLGFHVLEPQQPNNASVYVARGNTVTTVNHFSATRSKENRVCRHRSDPEPLLIRPPTTGKLCQRQQVDVGGGGVYCEIARKSEAGPSDDADYTATTTGF
jgi:hypothetical protein